MLGIVVKKSLIRMNLKPTGSVVDYLRIPKIKLIQSPNLAISPIELRDLLTGGFRTAY